MTITPARRSSPEGNLSLSDIQECLSMVDLPLEDREQLFALLIARIEENA